MLLRLLGPEANDAQAELKSLSSSPEPTVRANATLSLMIISGDSKKYETILNEMLQSGESSVRQAVAQSLVPSGFEGGGLVPALRMHCAIPTKQCGLTSQWR